MSCQRSSAADVASPCTCFGRQWAAWGASPLLMDVILSQLLVLLPCTRRGIYCKGTCDGVSQSLLTRSCKVMQALGRMWEHSNVLSNNKFAQTFLSLGVIFALLYHSCVRVKLTMETFHHLSREVSFIPTTPPLAWNSNMALWVYWKGIYYP